VPTERVRIPNAERTETTRAALLAATVEAISRYGYQGATSVRIAELSGFTRGAQKHHFDNKAELVSAALVEVHERWLQETFPKVEDAANSGIPAIVAALWASMHSDLWVASLELRVAARNDEKLQELLIPVERQIGRRAIDYAVGVLETGDVPRARVRELTELAFNTLRGMAFQRLLFANQNRETRQLRTLTELMERELRGEHAVAAVAADTE
jgi:AcrR family transcriptional regulator